MESEAEREVRWAKEEKFHQQMVTNLMAVVREWVAERGGMSGELKLIKTCGKDNQWGIQLVITNPINTWNLGV
jgi:hypothetical protein